MGLKVAIVPVTAYQQNCSILVCEDTKKAAIVDPGGDVEKLIDALNQLGVELEKVFITHGHLDHCAIAGQLSDQFSVPIEGPHLEDDFWIQQLPSSCQAMGFPATEVFTPSRWLEGGDTVSFGNQQLEVLFCPGHTPGHVVFYHREAKLALVGDVLFQGSIGRTDFPRGNHDQLISSIKDQLWPLGDDVNFIPGHGPNSTFGEERRSNPFVSDKNYG
ncbi:glyoxylase-like metal-dependent hydrolase (beta-lactamase superfamily II) [Sinobacterium caligoides]|uniref:Glyoxylase-like metal-dependent hydrolase (Beta-lactamase superfamily II) n=1 Tax=Sinobacterium caligoides TaxID=933926 RepID=A0A3N2DYS9_9GAMM|nr:MBL fold metallo-hydrolase [Sinobacterium caligoides]ROS04842.1 glyoxylase-like metal-dependent hydrolase (beta-lactamase superfamily II) [Sinobacterium caligoides]